MRSAQIHVGSRLRCLFAAWCLDAVEREDRVYPLVLPEAQPSSTFGRGGSRAFVGSTPRVAPPPPSGWHIAPWSGAAAARAVIVRVIVVTRRAVYRSLPSDSVPSLVLVWPIFFAYRVRSHTHRTVSLYRTVSCYIAQIYDTHVDTPPQRSRHTSRPAARRHLILKNRIYQLPQGGTLWKNSYHSHYFFWFVTGAPWY